MSDSLPMRLLYSDDVDALATSELGLAAAAQSAALAGTDGLHTGRVQVNGGVAWMRILAGIVDELDLVGYKEFHRVERRVRYHVHLFRASTGDPLGVVDGRRITGLRTASTAAIGARHWAGDRSIRLGLIGSGEEAKEGIRALTGALTVPEAVVWSPTPANREAFAAAMQQETGVPVRAVESQSEVYASSDAVYIATSSHHEPFIGYSDVESLGLVIAIGSTMPVHRELRGDVFTHAAEVVVDTPDACHESGDCIEGTEQGWDSSGAVLLGDYITREPTRDGTTVIKTIGSVEQDLVLAYHLIQAAERLDRGIVIDDVSSLRMMR